MKNDTYFKKRLAEIMGDQKVRQKKPKKKKAKRRTIKKQVNIGRPPKPTAILKSIDKKGGYSKLENGFWILLDEVVEYENWKIKKQFQYYLDRDEKL